MVYINEKNYPAVTRDVPRGSVIGQRLDHIFPNIWDKRQGCSKMMSWLQKSGRHCNVKVWKKL